MCIAAAPTIVLRKRILKSPAELRPSMTFTREQIRLRRLCVALDPVTLERLLAALPASGAAATATPRFDLTHILWYGGALIVIGAMTLFASLAFAQLGGGVLTRVAARLCRDLRGRRRGCSGARG